MSDEQPPTFYRVLMVLEAADGAWLPYARVWDSFGPSGHNSWVGRSLSQGQSGGLIERADETLSANRDAGWLYHLREHLADATGLSPGEVWDWLWAFRITDKGRRQLEFARAQNPQWSWQPRASAK